MRNVGHIPSPQPISDYVLLYFIYIMPFTMDMLRMLQLYKNLQTDKAVDS